MEPGTVGVFLGVYFHEVLKQFRDVLNIVEPPSLGIVRVTEKIGKLTAQSLWMILFEIQGRWPSAKIYIRCEIDHALPSLILRVINNGGRFDEKMQMNISLVSEWAKRRDLDPSILAFEYGQQEEGWFVALSISLQEQ